MTEFSPNAPVCVVTGGSAGIGLAIARKFAASGYQIALCGRDPQKLSAAQQSITAEGGVCRTESLDVQDIPALQTFLINLQSDPGRIDVLVNNTGRAPVLALEAVSEEEFRQTMAVNVDAVFFATQTVWPIMKAQGGGVIINISSLASVDPFVGFSVYGAGKAWVNLFTRATADEGKEHNIRVYCAALGAVDTDLLRGLFPDFPQDQRLTPEEVADFVAQFPEPPMQHLSGQTFFLKR